MTNLTASNASVTQLNLPEPAFRQAYAELIQAWYHKGWTPATSSNFSFRSSELENGFYCSISGLDKEHFSANDFMPVDFNVQSLDTARPSLKPSAEALLHSLIYQSDASAQVVVHTHSPNAVAISLVHQQAGEITLEGLELLKGFAAIKTHETVVTVPIFPNHQDMAVIAEQVKAYQVQHPTQPLYGFLLAGHGLYTWGNSLSEAKRHLEVFDALFQLQLTLKQFQNS